MAQQIKPVLHMGARISRLENAIAAILEKLELPELETFYDNPTEKQKAVTPQHSVEPVPVPVNIEITPYEYKKLDPNSRQIRLFELTPLNSGINDPGTITGSLKIYSLDQFQDPTRNMPKPIDLSSLPPKTDPRYVEEYKKLRANRRIKFDYNALSYTWGEPVMDTKILVDGKSYLVTKSLRSALAKLSRKKTTGTNMWWIDQICVYLTVYVPFRN
jgi:hypothetical protein